jgi:hypothetical protein
MFHAAKRFNQPLNHWDVSKVESMKFMFYEAKAFNQPLSRWDIHNVRSMSHMFAFAVSFNQPLHTWRIREVTFSEVINSQQSDGFVVIEIDHMFDGATAFNPSSIAHWQITNRSELIRSMRFPSMKTHRHLRDKSWTTKAYLWTGRLFS